MQGRRKPYKPPTCSACGQEGHRKNSPKCRLHGKNLMPNTNDASPRTVGATHQATTNSLGSQRHFFVLFDKETTRFSRLVNDFGEIWWSNYEQYFGKATIRHSSEIQDRHSRRLQGKKVTTDATGYIFIVPPTHVGQKKTKKTTTNLDLISFPLGVLWRFSSTTTRYNCSFLPNVNDNLSICRDKAVLMTLVWMKLSEYIPNGDRLAVRIWRKKVMLTLFTLHEYKINILIL